ncbi:MAG: hypothetical protein PHO15_10280 [Eubacteriales bacterium]|nr:hypothetical protein [Eubacteriales bacterium]
MSIKRHKKLFTLAIIIIALSCAGLSGYLIAKNEPRVVDEADDVSSAVPVAADEARIANDATVEWDYEYMMCCHHIYVSCAVGEDMAGLTFSELSEAYPDIKIVAFGTDTLVLKKTFDCYCPEHYILKKYRDALAVYRTALGTDKQYVYIEISVAFDVIDDEQQQVLEAGKVFNNLADIESYLEDIET